MRPFSIHFFFLAGMLFACGGGSFQAEAADYFIAPLESVGVDGGDAKAVETLVRASLKRQGQQVVDREKSAEFVVRPKLVRLGQSFILTLDKFEDEKPRYTAQMRAAVIEEMDRVSERAVAGLIAETPVEKTGEIGKVTASESLSEAARKPAVPNWYVGFGPAGSQNLGDVGIMLGFSGSYGWQVSPRVALAGFLELTSATDQVADASLIGVGLRGQYSLNAFDNAPFAALQAGYGNANGVDEAAGDVNGFLLGTGVGYRFFRTSSVNLEVALQYTVILKDGPAGIPGIYGARLGLYF